jgi:hypothetical protein
MATHVQWLAKKDILRTILPILIPALACQTFFGTSTKSTQYGLSATGSHFEASSQAATELINASPHLSFPEVNTGFKSGNWLGSILSWGIVNDINDNKPDPGMQFLAIDIALLNRADSWVQIDLYDHTQIQDPKSGKTYPISSYYDPLDNSEIITKNGIGPGEHRRGLCVYQVPKGSSELVFMFSPESADWTNSDVKSISLTQEKSTETLPKEFTMSDPGAIQLEENLQVDDLSIRVVGWQNQPVNSDTSSSATNAKLITVESLVTNISKDKYIGNIGGGFDLELKDLSGRSYQGLPPAYVFGAFATESLLTLAPGETGYIKTNFIIPLDAINLELTVTYYGPHKRYSSSTISPDPVLHDRGYISLDSMPMPELTNPTITGKIAPGLHPKGEQGVFGLFSAVVKNAQKEKSQTGYFNIKGPGILVDITYNVTYTGNGPKDYLSEFMPPLTAGNATALLKTGAGVYYRSGFRKYNNAQLKPGDSVEREEQFYISDTSIELFLVLEDTIIGEKAFFGLQ